MEKIRNFFDFYNVGETSINKICDYIEMHKLNGVCFFEEDINTFSDLNVKQILLLNYPDKKYSFDSLIKKILGLPQHIDEVEFPWQYEYNQLSLEKTISEFSKVASKGIKLRPMIEAGVWTSKKTTNTLGHLFRVGISEVCTSTGLYKDILNAEGIKNLLTITPRGMKLKAISNIKDLETAKNIKKTGVFAMGVSTLL